ncbi:MAG: shikimate dehydrogenase [Patescibacteria group bacterium]
MTKQYGILAYPAKHSLSSAVQNAAFSYLKIDAQFGVFEIQENDVAAFMERVKNDPISGLSVSSPYKEVIMNYIDEVDEDAKKIGAVNTVVNRGGVLCGYNTDFIGATKALADAFGNLKNKKFVIIGAGGAARAVVYGILKEGGIVEIYNRTSGKANGLADYFGKMFGVNIISGDLKDMLSVTGDALIQTTSIWITEPGSVVEDLFPRDFVKNFKVVMDIVHKPLITPVLAAAKEYGIQIISCDKMFLYQAFEQFKLWTGKEPPREVMGETLKKSLV